MSTFKQTNGCAPDSLGLDDLHFDQQSLPTFSKSLDTIKLTMSAPGPLQELLSKHGQEHVLAYWDDLSPARQEAFEEELRAIDYEQLAGLFKGEAQDHDWAEIARGAEHLLRCAWQIALQGRGAA